MVCVCVCVCVEGVIKIVGEKYKSAYNYQVVQHLFVKSWSKDIGGHFLSAQCPLHYVTIRGAPPH